MWAVLIVIAVIVVLALILVGIYNGMVRARNRVDEAWSGIDVQLKRRHDLIPNLVETVKGYAAHEKEVFEAVTQARANAMSAQAAGPAGAAQVAQAEGALTGALGRLFAVAEAYPQLRATENFQQLQAELTNTEDQIAGARRIYNGNVQDYNTRIQTFPGAVFAGMFGFTKREFFEIDSPADREVPSVSFGQDSDAARTPPPAASAPRCDCRRRRAGAPRRGLARLSDPPRRQAPPGARRARRDAASRSAARNCIAQPGLPQLTTLAPLARIASTRLVASCRDSSGCVNEYTPAAPQQRPAPASSTGS